MAIPSTNKEWHIGARFESYNDDDPCGTLTDQSSNGYDGTAAGSARPIFKTNIVNSQSVFRGDGANTTVDCNDIAQFFEDDNEWTIYIVINRHVDGVGGGVFIVEGDQNTKLRMRPQDEWQFSRAAGGRTEMIRFADLTTDWYIVTLSFDGVVGELRHNDWRTNQVTMSAGDAAMTTFELFYDGSNELDGDIAEVILYSEYHSDATKTSINEDLATLYDITLETAADVTPTRPPAVGDIVIPDRPTSNVVFAATDGDAGNAGTEASPYDFETAMIASRSGSNVIFKGGVYTYDSDLNFGIDDTEAAQVIIYGEDDERVIVTRSDNRSPNLKFKWNVDVVNMWFGGTVSDGSPATTGQHKSDCTFYNCTLFQYYDQGLNEGTNTRSRYYGNRFVSCGGTGLYQAMYLNYNHDYGDGPVVEENIFLGSATNGIKLGGDQPEYATIRYNFFSDIGNCMAPSPLNSLLFRNIFWNATDIFINSNSRSKFDDETFIAEYNLFGAFTGGNYQPIQIRTPSEGTIFQNNYCVDGGVIAGTDYTVMTDDDWTVHMGHLTAAEINTAADALVTSFDAADINTIYADDTIESNFDVLSDVIFNWKNATLEAEASTDMTDTLFDLTYSLASMLGYLRTGIATSGSQTTVVDTVRRTENDDWFNEGTVWIIEDAGGASAAPEGEWSVVTDFVQSTGTLTFGALTAAVAANDKYAVAPAMFPVDLLVEKINQALMSINVVNNDTTSLDTVSGQTEYDLPTAVMRGDLRNVYIQTVDDADDNRWKQMGHWKLLSNTTGNADTLVIDPGYPANIDLRLEYVARHTPIYDASDQINEAVHRNRVLYRAAEHMMIEMMAQNDGSPTLNNRANYFRDKADEADAKYPVTLPSRHKNATIIKR